jgi:hypothetical protein
MTDARIGADHFNVVVLENQAVTRSAAASRSTPATSEAMRGTRTGASAANPLWLRDYERLSREAFSEIVDRLNPELLVCHER